MPPSGPRRPLHPLRNSAGRGGGALRRCFEPPCVRRMSVTGKRARLHGATLALGRLARESRPSRSGRRFIACDLRAALSRSSPSQARLACPAYTAEVTPIFPAALSRQSDNRSGKPLCRPYPASPPIGRSDRTLRQQNPHDLVHKVWRILHDSHCRASSSSRRPLGGALEARGPEPSFSMTVALRPRLWLLLPKLGESSMYLMRISRLAPDMPLTSRSQTNPLL
jgi:hypothetical protein